MKSWQTIERDGLRVLKLDQPVREGRALDAILSGLWLIEPMAFARLLAIAATAGDKPQASEGGWLIEEPRTSMEIDGGSAIIRVSGPIFPKANLMTKHSGATPLSAVEREFSAAMDDPAVERIVLEIDSPGGVSTGISSFAEKVFAARGRKPVIAVAQDLAASAAYWIASSAEEFTATPVAFMGSIGVVMTAYRSQQYEDEIVLVSSQSPKKRQDPGSESGRSDLQALVDGMAGEFIGAVAKYRGTTAEDVAENFGRGGMMIASSAIAVGMADGISSRQQVISRTEAEPMIKLTAQQVAADHPEIAEQFRAEGAAAAAKSHATANSTAIESARAEGRKEGATAELARVKGVLETPALGHDSLVREAALDGKSTSADVALKVLTAEQQARRTALDQRRTDAPPPLAPVAAAAPAAVDPALPFDERCKAEWDAKPELREEFQSLDQYKAFAKANERGQVKVLKGKAA